MKKKLNIEGITNELEGASLFFSKPASKPVPVQSSPDTASTTPLVSEAEKSDIAKKPPKPKVRVKEQTTSISASTLASNQASNHETMTEAIRKMVKQTGKETVFLRLTPEEKRAIKSIVFSLNEMYQRDFRETTENEIGRIALRFLLEDYKENGKESMLIKVLTALNA
jgi:hypothetical protein